mgnify:CR=1 FL=1
MLFQCQAGAKQNYFSYQAIIDRCNGKCKRHILAPDGNYYAWDNTVGVRKAKEDLRALPGKKAAHLPRRTGPLLKFYHEKEVGTHEQTRHESGKQPVLFGTNGAAKVNDRFSSREGAADETGIDRTRLARIELDSITPYPEEVMLLADAYDAPQLLNFYCSTCCPIGRQNVKPCALQEFDRVMMQALAALQGADKVSAAIISIARDAAWTPARM